MRRRQDFTDAHALEALPEHVPVDRVAVAEEVGRGRNDDDEGLPPGRPPWTARPTGGDRSVEVSAASSFACDGQLPQGGFSGAGWRWPPRTGGAEHVEQRVIIGRDSPDQTG